MTLRKGQVWSYLGIEDYRIIQVYQKTNLAEVPVEMVLLRSFRDRTGFPYQASQLQHPYWSLKQDVSLDQVGDVLAEILGLSS